MRQSTADIMPGGTFWRRAKLPGTTGSRVRKIMIRAHLTSRLFEIRCFLRDPAREKRKPAAGSSVKIGWTPSKA
jgi:hypothetical protein